MSPEDVVRRMWDAINARDLPSVAGAIAERCEWTSMPTGQTHVGPEAMVRGVQSFHETFPDGRSDIERLYVCGDVVVIEWRTSGTRASDGSSFSRRGCSVAEIRGGKIAVYRDYFDRQSLSDQLPDAASGPSAPTAAADAPGPTRPRPG